MVDERGLNLITISGIPIKLGYSAFLAPFVFFMVGGLPLLLLYPALAVSILCHELGHAFTARKFGIGCSTITLNFLGGVALLDWDIERLLDEKTNGKQEMIVAFAGPLVSFMIGLLVMPMAYALNSSWLLIIAQLNIIIGLFNLIPVFPLDGGRIVRGFLSWLSGYETATRTTLWLSRAGALALGAWALALELHFILLIALLALVMNELEAKFSILSYRLAKEKEKYNNR